MKPTPTLAEIQSLLSALILDEPAARRSRIERWITPARGEHVRERLAVYIDGYPARLQEALCEAFPAIEHVIGAKEMCALVRRFASTARLRSYNLNDVGADLPRVLRTDPITQRLPFLPDLAELEWRVLRAFHAAERDRFDPSSVAMWDHETWSRAVLQFQPSAMLVGSEWPIHEIWEAREAPLDQVDIELNGRPVQVLVRREGHAVICEPLAADEAQALQLLLGGLPLGMAMGTLSRRGVPAESISRWFQRWIGLGMVHGVRLTDTASL